MAKHGEKKSSFERLKEAASLVGLPRPDLAIPPAPTAPTRPQDSWQIVVAGVIDARQHHPQWYRMIECISDAELASAQTSFTIIGLPTPAGIAVNSAAPPVSLARFDVGAFAVTAVSDKWVIQTSAEETRRRILDVAEIVFAKLSESSVIAFGVNRVSHARLERLTANQLLADKLIAADLSMPPGKAEARVSYTCHLEGYDTNIHLTPASEDKWLSFIYNRHHPIPPQSGYFDLGKMIREHAESDWQSAKDYGAELADSIKRAERK